jgi:hypothetical protein
MNKAAAGLTQRERDLNTNFKQLHEQQAALTRADQDMMQRRIEIAASARDVMKMRTLDSQTKERSEGVILPRPPMNDKNVNGPSMTHQQMIAELDLARKTLSKTRSQLTSAAYTKASTQSFLDNESLLLERIESTRKF